MQGPHRRYNPLLDEWGLCSPHRLARPWQGQVESGAVPALAAYDPACYLCPGNARAGGVRNPDYAATFVFDNDYPALLPEAGDLPGDGDLLRARAQTGVCRVLCFSPRHDLSLARMPVAAIRAVVDTWAHQQTELGSRDDVAWVQIFENRGEMMGCSNPHPHGQIWASSEVPGLAARAVEAQRRHHAGCGRDLLGDYLDRELELAERIVCRNDHWVALVPFWAVWPFETLLLPVRRAPDLASLEDAERDALADLLRRLGARYDNLFGCPFPYSMGWRGRPSDGEEHPGVRLHASYLPPLLRSATIRKFLVGYELAAEPQRDLTPEAAAARLRECSETHYLDAEA